MENKLKHLSKKQMTSLIVCSIVVVAVIACVVVLSFFYAIHGFRIYRKCGIWEYWRINEKQESYLIQTKAKIPETVVPEEMFGHKITDVYARNINKLFISTNATAIRECSSNIIVLNAVDPRTYNRGLYKDSTNKPSYYIKATKLCVPKEYQYLYVDLYDMDFVAANVSYMLNYENIESQGYIYVTKQGEEDAKAYVLAHKAEYLNEYGLFNGDYDSFLKENYGVFIDTSSFNGGYHWVDYLEEGDKILTIPSNPEREGFTFTGWYLDKECTTVFDFNAYIKDANSLVLYAGWELNK